MLLIIFFFLQREKHFNDVKICLTEKKRLFFTYFTHFFGVTFQSFIEFYKVLFRLPRTRTNDFWNICMQTIHKIYWKVPAETSLKNNHNRICCKFKCIKINQHLHVLSCCNETAKLCHLYRKIFLYSNVYST